jgi:hypothetical protein
MNQRCVIGDDLRCTVCGRRAFGVNVIRACRPRLGLGDHVAEGLAAVGITKARAQAVAAAVGLRDCGCQERQDAWNRFGYALGIGTPPPPPAGPNP